MKLRILLAVFFVALTSCSSSDGTAPAPQTTPTVVTTTPSATVQTPRTTTTAAAQVDSRIDRLDGLLDGWADGSSPVGVVALAVGPDGELWSAAAGDPDVTTDGLFEIGSITKTLVAATALRLEADGRLDLDAAVASYAPALAPTEETTLRQLLSHTSGLVDGDFDFSLEALLDFDRRYDPSELIEPTLAAEVRRPSGVYGYANSGYWIIGGILETVTGEPLESTIRRMLLEPLDMSATYLAWAESVPEPLVPGYVAFAAESAELPLGTSPIPAMVTGAWSAGGIVSTAEDIATFYQALFDGTLVGDESLNAMLTPPTGSTYGLGIDRRTADGLEAWGHNGAIPGYRSSVIHDPATGITMVVLANRLRGDLDTEPIASALLAASIDIFG